MYFLMLLLIISRLSLFVVDEFSFDAMKKPLDMKKNGTAELITVLKKPYAENGLVDWVWYIGTWHATTQRAKKNLNMSIPL